MIIHEYLNFTRLEPAMGESFGVRAYERDGETYEDHRYRVVTAEILEGPPRNGDCTGCVWRANGHNCCALRCRDYQREDGRFIKLVEEDDRQSGQA